ncbi:MAG TPA: radical SAM protein [Alphaproteobacteria bacterium]|nr:radical SAM protein [Alphaproteobacteria bacterium]
MRVLLISPEYPDSRLKFTKKEVRAFWFPRLSCVALAALTPPEHDVVFIDEAVDTVPLHEHFDVVGISVMTAMAHRAYEIADHFRARGAKVVLGGMHPTALPAEGLQHADAVVIGEAEELWAPLLHDVVHGELKPIYKSDRFPPMENIPIPRRDLFQPGAYMTTNCVQATRGCPYGCDFCTVTEFFGGKFRLRPIANVVEEVAHLPGKFVVFVDDNITGHRKYAKELFTALAALGKKWGSQTTLNMADDAELLDLAAQSGCSSMFVGLETINEGNLKSVNKYFNKVSKYREQFQKFHDRGIMMNTGIIFGFDGDHEGVFEKTVDFLERNQIELAQFSVLTPLPGTRQLERMHANGRLTTMDWRHYDGMHCVFRPQQMSPQVLEEGCYWAWQTYYSIPSILRRILKPGEKVLEVAANMYFNWAYRRMVNRLPQGALTPLAKIFDHLQAEIAATARTPGDGGEHSVATLQVQLGRNYLLHCTDTLLLNLEGVLNEHTAASLKDRINTVVNRTRSDLLVHFGGITSATPKALQILFDSTQRVFEQHRTRMILQDVGESLQAWLSEITMPSYVSVIGASPEATAAGN